MRYNIDAEKKNMYMNILTLVLIKNYTHADLMEGSTHINESINLFLTWKYIYSIFLAGKL